MQAVGAGQFGVLSIDAVVELVAHSGIGVGEETVLAWAVGVTFGRLQLTPVSAVNVEGLVTLVDLTNGHVED